MLPNAHGHRSQDRGTASVHLEHAETCKLTAEYNRGDLTGQIIRLEKEVSRMMDDMDAHGIRRTETSGE